MRFVLRFDLASAVAGFTAVRPVLASAAMLVPAELRWHVLQSALVVPGELASLWIEHLRRAKICQLGTKAVFGRDEEDVLGLEVAVHDVVVFEMTTSVRDVTEQATFEVHHLWSVRGPLLQLLAQP